MAQEATQERGVPQVRDAGLSRLLPDACEPCRFPCRTEGSWLTWGGRGGCLPDSPCPRQPLAQPQGGSSSHSQLSMLVALSLPCPGSMVVIAWSLCHWVTVVSRWPRLSCTVRRSSTVCTSDNKLWSPLEPRAGPGTPDPHPAMPRVRILCSHLPGTASPCSVTAQDQPQAQSQTSEPWRSRKTLPPPQSKPTTKSKGFQGVMSPVPKTRPYTQITHPIRLGHCGDGDALETGVGFRLTWPQDCLQPT